MSTSDRSLAPRAVKPKLVKTNTLEANPYNPRRLFDKEPMDVLRASIRKVGILVPLVVYWSKRKKKYVILDGQRRWMCAQALQLREVPVNVVSEPSIVQNIVTMFQIHKLREDWELMPTALTLAILVKETGEKNDRRLSEITGLDVSVVSRCKKLLSYPKKYQDMMLDSDPSKRVKADFFIELYAVRNDRAVNKMHWFKKNEFTGQMLEKYQGGKSGLKAVTDFRLMKQYINNARKAKQVREVSKRMEEFVADDTLTLEHLNIPSADVSASARRLLQAVSKLEEALRPIDAERYFGQEELWKALESLRDLIALKLREADRRVK
jgi:ParB/RepB/Spo0J family partition protein